jgi:hypothetical protein
MVNKEPQVFEVLIKKFAQRDDENRYKPFCLFIFTCICIIVINFKIFIESASQVMCFAKGKSVS